MKEATKKMSAVKTSTKKTATKKVAEVKKKFDVKSLNKDFFKRNFSYIIIVALVLVILFQRACTPSTTKPGDIVKVNGKKYEVVSHEIDTIETVHDSIVYKKGKDIYHDTTIYVPIPTHEPIDTLAILKEYYAKNIYKDTLNFPSSLGYIALEDTISRNSILARKYDLHLIERQIEDKLIVKELPRTQVYFGTNLGVVKPYPMAGGSLFIKNKRDQMYGINVGYTSNLDMYAQGTLLWKISFRKK